MTNFLQINNNGGYMKKSNVLFVGLLFFLSVTGAFGQDYVRKVVEVPKVDSGAVKIDGVMDESAWDNAAHADLITSTGYEIFDFPYNRDGLSEPEFDALYGRMLWSKDTLYVFIHIDEYVNDSTNLFWLTDNDTWWGGDQLFVSLSNRLGVNMSGDYHGNVYAAPDGPYHFLILGDQVTLNGGFPTFVPDEYRGDCPDDSLNTFLASDIARYAVTIDSANGVWDIEMAIYNPNIALQSSLGFNIGGSTGSSEAYDIFGDAYGYYTWQPNISNDPFGDPFGNGDPGFYNLANSDYWALLNFVSGTTDIKEENGFANVPKGFKLMQNFPNPFNPSTTIRFQISQASPVTLKIYNTLGQVVATLVNGKPLAAGTYSVDWDASQFASGVYFYELKTNDVVQSKKMILLK